MTINKKTVGIICLFVGIILLIVGFGVNIVAGFDLMSFIGFIVPGVIFLVAGIILLALYLHSVT